MIDRPRAIFPFYNNIRYLFTRNCYHSYIDAAAEAVATVTVVLVAMLVAAVQRN